MKRCSNGWREKSEGKLFRSFPWSLRFPYFCGCLQQEEDEGEGEGVRKQIPSSLLYFIDPLLFLCRSVVLVFSVREAEKRGRRRRSPRATHFVVSRRQAPSFLVLFLVTTRRCSRGIFQRGWKRDGKETGVARVQYTSVVASWYPVACIGHWFAFYSCVVKNY